MLRLRYLSRKRPTLPLPGCPDQLVDHHVRIDRNQVLLRRKIGKTLQEVVGGLLGMWAGYGPAPSAEEIDEGRKEMFSSFGRDDIA